MTKGKVDSLYIKTWCGSCGRESVSDGNCIIECACGEKYRVESSVKITTQKVTDKDDSIVKG